MPPTTELRRLHTPRRTLLRDASHVGIEPLQLLPQYVLYALPCPIAVVLEGQEYEASGAQIRNPPTNYWWAYEMQIEDLDGNVLRIGSDPKEGEPFGSWLDMHGDRWIQSEDGDWTRVSE